jgi:Nucleoside 2-deoxyribosyltransferase like
MRVFNAPEKITKVNKPSVFLAGSIDDGHSKNWQNYVIEFFSDGAIDIYNPRRIDWDASWKQHITDTNFYEQVTWELKAMEMAESIIMNFVPGSLSPISLLEFGLHANTSKLSVCCPEAFWKSGNFQIVCQHFNIPFFDDLNELLKTFK